MHNSLYNLQFAHDAWNICTVCNLNVTILCTNSIYIFHESTAEIEAVLFTYVTEYLQ